MCGLRLQRGSGYEEVSEASMNDPSLSQSLIEFQRLGYLAATWDVNKLEEMKDEIVQGDKLKVRMSV